MPKNSQIAWRITSFLLLFSLLSFGAVFPNESVLVHAASIPAFPGAEGWGAQSVGGRGGKVIEVTNLNDSGAGSLRACIDALGARTCVFRVAGEIPLSSRLEIKNPYITIAGQTAPGDGITLVGSELVVPTRMEVWTHDVIIRYIKWRHKLDSFIAIGPTNSSPKLNEVHDVIIDHCSVNGGSGTMIQVRYFDTTEARADLQEVTVQNCIMAEHIAKGMVVGGIVDSDQNPIGVDKIHHVSLHHNYFVHAGYRNPNVKSQHTEVINNVVYNYQNRIMVIGRQPEVDVINNYWLNGVNSNPDLAIAFEPLNVKTCVPFANASIYVNGNIAPLYGLNSASQDNWYLLERHDTRCGVVGDPVSEDHRRFSPLAQPTYPVTVSSALGVYTDVVNNAGANAHLDSNGNFVLQRDSVDQLFVDDFFSKSFSVNLDTCDNIGEARIPCQIEEDSSLDPGTLYTDTDSDGMADEWENLKFGTLAYGSSSDSSSDFDGDGYTDLEEFLNGTDPTGGAAPPPPPPLPPPPPPGPVPPPPAPVPDTTPPVTSILCDGSACIFPQYESPLTVTLSCTDNDSGCSMTQYCTDTTNSCSPTTTYNSSTPLVLSTLGTHYVRYFSTDNAPEGNTETTKSTELTIVKEGPSDGDTQAPTLSNLQPTGVLPAGTTQTTLSVTTSEQGRCGYSTTPGVLSSPSPVPLDTTNGTTHTVLVTGLTNGASYTYYIQCADNQKNISDEASVQFSVAGGQPSPEPQPRERAFPMVVVVIGILIFAAIIIIILLRR